MFGQFETDYVFKADYPWLKGITFFMFQMLMTVTTLNLLIAVMTQSYSRVGTHLSFQSLNYFV